MIGIYTSKEAGPFGTVVYEDDERMLIEPVPTRARVPVERNGDCFTLSHLRVHDGRVVVEAKK